MKKTILALSILTCSLAMAHHSYNAFVMDSEKTISGTVKKFDWTNPHSWIWIESAGDNGVTQLWGIEGMSPNYLSRRGWSRTTLKPGDKISITIHPLRTGEPGGSFVSAKRPNGDVLSQTPPITEP